MVALTPMMNAAYAAELNTEDPLSALVVGERPRPEPPPGWVRVRVRAASLNQHDLWSLRGVGLDAARLPMILGSDAAGELEDGTPVIVHPMIAERAWTLDRPDERRATLLSEVHQGTLAEELVVPAANVVRKPESLSYPAAACLGTAWLTAYGMLFRTGGMRPGQTILVQGATGGVASALIQLGRATGLRVYATARSEEKRRFALELGAHEAFEPGARLPRRVDGAFETVGEATWAHSLRCVRPGGVVVCAGATTGEHPSAELRRVFFHRLRILGSVIGPTDELVDLIDLLSLTGIEPAIGAEVPLAKARDAFQAMAEGRTFGKIVVTGDDT